MTLKLIQTPPQVFLVGISTPVQAGIDGYLAYRGVTWNTPDPLTPEAIPELAGRVCYLSFQNPSNKTRKEYLQTGIIEHKHGSVLEHLWLNFLVADLPRSSQLELVRHGDGTAFSFESTRFTDKHMRFVVPPRIRKDDDVFLVWRQGIEEVQDLYRSIAPDLIDESDEGTLKRKRAKEAARSVLPNALGSDGMVSMNARSLRWIVELRSDEHADQSIREFANEVFRAAEPWLPAILADAYLVAPENGGTPQVKFITSKV